MAKDKSKVKRKPKAPPEMSETPTPETPTPEMPETPEATATTAEPPPPSPTPEPELPERTLGLTVRFDGGTVKVTAVADGDTWRDSKARPQLNKLLATLTSVLAQAGPPESDAPIQRADFELTKGDGPYMKMVAQGSLAHAGGREVRDGKW